jgi:hypothetical protein
MKYTRIPEDTFKKLQLNAGIIATDFDPTTGEVEEASIFGATTGGNTFAATPTFSDYGEDIDNCPKNMKELKKLDSWDVSLAGTALTVNTDTAKRIVGVADIDSEDETHIIPRNDVADGDFKDLWWIGDYSDQNGAKNGGFIAIKIENALSTGGFQIKSTDKSKGQFAFTFTGHYSMKNQDKPPFDIYIRAGEAETSEDETSEELGD